MTTPEASSGRDRLYAELVGAAEKRTGRPHRIDDDGMVVPVITDEYRNHVLDQIAAELGIDLEGGAA